MGRASSGIIALLTTWLMTLAVGADPPPVPANYISISSKPCRVTVPKKNRTLAEELLEVCEDRYYRIYRQLGLLHTGSPADESLDEIEIRVVSDPKQMRILAPPHAAPPSWSAAVAYPEHSLIILALRDRLGSPVRELDVVLEHELSHLAMRQVLDGRDVPRWFSEGVAIQQSEASSFRRHWLVWLAARGGSLLPLESIDNYPDQPGQVNLAYAQAADFLGFLLRKEGWLGVRIVLRERARGAPFVEAFEKAFEMPLSSLEASWRRGLENRWQWLPLVTGTGAVWGVMAVLFLLAYVVAKRRKSRRLAEMEAEEAEDKLQRVVPLAQQKSPGKSPPLARPEIRTKIRVDDEIHTLH